MSALGPCRCGHPGAGCTCYDERLAEVVRQPAVATGEPLDGPQAGTETPEAPGGSHGGAEPVEPEPPVFVFTRADAALVMALLVSGRGRQRRSTWSEAEQAAEQRLNDYWLGRIEAECTHPEPPRSVDTADILQGMSENEQLAELVGAMRQPSDAMLEMARVMNESLRELSDVMKGSVATLVAEGWPEVESRQLVMAMTINAVGPSKKDADADEQGES